MELRRIARRLRWSGIALSLPVLAALAWAGLLQLTGNFHVVSPGEVYRSAQINGQELRETLRFYRIRTIINLRGNNKTKPWYDDEVATAESLGVQHEDLALSANRELTTEEESQLVHLLRTAPRPILIHCQSGADRTGLASALYEHLVDGRSASDAIYQLSFRFGHFPYFGNSTSAMDRTFSRMSKAFATGG
jgi:protein tyrosine/serine phosphatase